MTIPTLAHDPLRRARHLSWRLPSIAVAAFVMLLASAAQRAEALSPVNPGTAAAKQTASELTIEVRGGHGGGGGHGYSGGGGVRGGSFSSGPAVSAGRAWSGHVAAGPGFVGHRFHHHFRHRHGVFIGGVYYDDYPYGDDYSDYDYPPSIAVPGCRIVPTAYGPRPVCHTRAVRHHRHYARHYHRRHHHA